MANKLTIDEKTESVIRTLATGAGVVMSEEVTRILDVLQLAWEERNRQIFLLRPLELLNEARILNHVSAQLELELHWALDSTNTYLMQIDQQQRASGLQVCLAEQQFAGRGRRGKTWVSPFGQNIYLSLGYLFNKPVAEMSGLSLLVGMQVVKTLRAFGVDGIGLKWPNDIIMGSGKLAGILVELAPPNRNFVYGVMGIGVNFALSESDSEKIDQPWSGLGGSISRNDLVGRLLENLSTALVQFQRDGFAGFHHEWDDYNLYRDKAVVVHQGEEKIQGTDVGIDPEGNLLIDTGDEVLVFNAGEVSMRPGH